jgi:hypothetical protein
MIEPLITPYIFSSKENIYEILRRIHYKYRTSLNPLNKFKVNNEQYKSYYKFTFVRNPWERAFSWYKNVMRDEIHKSNHKIKENLSLKYFLRRYAGRGMLRPQTYWIKSFNGGINLDYIGRFENITEDFNKICSDMHIPQVKLPHKVKGSNGDYRDHYDEEAINIVKFVYKEEIEKFNYSFNDIK